MVVEKGCWVWGEAESKPTMRPIGTLEGTFEPLEQGRGHLLSGGGGGTVTNFAA